MRSMKFDDQMIGSVVWIFSIIITAFVLNLNRRPVYDVDLVVVNLVFMYWVHVIVRVDTSVRNGAIAVLLATMSMVLLIPIVHFGYTLQLGIISILGVCLGGAGFGTRKISLKAPDGHFDRSDVPTGTDGVD